MLSKIICLCAAVTLVAGSALTVLASPRYTIVDLGYFPGNNNAWAINDNGDTATFRIDSGVNNSKAVYWHNGTPTVVDSLGGWDNRPVGINNAGQLVGYSSLADGQIRGYIRYQNQTTILNPISGRYSWASSINNIGDIAGYCSSSSGLYTAAVWWGGSTTPSPLGALGGNYTTALAINDAKQVTGASSTGLKDYRGYDILHAYRWQNGAMEDLDTLIESASCVGIDINNSGQVVGRAWNGSHYRAVLWNDDHITELGAINNGLWSEACGINNLGQIVGYSDDGARHDHAFLYENGKMLDLNNLIQANSGWTLSEANAISNTGYIVGHGYVNGSWQDRAFLLVPVPEPPSIMVLLAGVAGTLAFVRQRM